MANQGKITEPFLDALCERDEVSLVLRAHLHIEALLIQIINSRIPFPDLLPRLRFEQSLKLACALGLDKELQAPLKALGEIRNRFSHQLDAKLSEGSVDTFMRTFSDTQLAELEVIVTAQREQIGNHIPMFKGMHHRDIFPLALSFLFSLLLDYVHQS